MILAAGRGERMRELTHARPKPLLNVANKSLIEHLILRLRDEGFSDLVVNHAYHGRQIIDALGDGRTWGVRIRHAPEPFGALNTGGALKNALPMLGDQPFLVVNADVWTDCPFAELREASIGDAHLVLVPNPPYRDDGDFALDGTLVRNEGAPKFTFAGISVYRPRFFDNCPDGSFHITPWLRQAADEERLTGQLFHGRWMDVGTPERLASLKKEGAV